VTPSGIEPATFRFVAQCQPKVENLEIFTDTKQHKEKGKNLLGRDSLEDLGVDRKAIKSNL
jgi:hypothetical protein